MINEIFAFLTKVVFARFDKRGRRNIKFIQLTHDADRTTGIAKFLLDVEIVTSVFRYYFHLHSVRKRES